jgi:hypothetical protein
MSYFLSNTAAQIDQTISGLYQMTQLGNTNAIIAGEKTVVLGGHSNEATGCLDSFIGAGNANAIRGNYSSVVGGIDNFITGENSFIGGGAANQSPASFAFVGAGQENINSGSYSFVGAGQQNIIRSAFGFIGGGYGNGINGAYSFIGGGFGNSTNQQYSFIGAGNGNVNAGFQSFIGAGSSNLITGSNIFNCFIGGGADNKVSLDRGVILGGRENTGDATDSSIVAGRRASIDSSHNGAGIWADSTSRYKNSRSANSLLLDFTSGVYFKLPPFTGSSAQTGMAGECRISGSNLYVCTGARDANGEAFGWGRLSLSTF